MPSDTPEAKLRAFFDALIPGCKPVKGIRADVNDMWCVRDCAYICRLVGVERGRERPGLSKREREERDALSTAAMPTHTRHGTV